MPESASDIAAEAEALLEKIAHAVRLVTPDAPMHSHTSWEVCEMLEAMSTDHLTAVEMMAMAAVLAGANARRLGSAAVPSLRLVPQAG